MLKEKANCIQGWTVEGNQVNPVFAGEKKPKSFWPIDDIEGAADYRDEKAGKPKVDRTEKRIKKVEYFGKTSTSASLPDDALSE